MREHPERGAATVDRPSGRPGAPCNTRRATSEDSTWVARILSEQWAGTNIVSRGRVHDATLLPALIAEEGRERVGLATFRLEGADAELVSLNAVVRGRGVGTALLLAVAEAAAAAGCRRLSLITSNDNLEALRFYQRRGLRLVAVHRGAVDEARRLKPEIPIVGEHGIAIHDELELELCLGLEPADRRVRL